MTLLHTWSPCVGDQCVIDRPYFFTADLKGSVAIITSVYPEGYVDIIVPKNGRLLTSWLIGRLKPLNRRTTNP